MASTENHPSDPPHEPIESLLDSDATGRELAHRLTRDMDAWLGDAWSAHVPAPMASSCVLYALGGYGRRELSPGSDLDIVVEVHDPALLDDPKFSEVIEDLMRSARAERIRLSQAVRTLAQAREMLEHDERIPISLLDARPLLGDASLISVGVGAEDARRFLRGHDEGVGFVARLLSGAEARRQRTAQTPYLLEPDVKNGAGGLRDVHTLRWAARVRFDEDPLGGAIPDAHWTGKQSEVLSSALETLTMTRHHLHAASGRKQDRLRFAEQEIAAARCGLGVEDFMRAYYKDTRTVHRFISSYLPQWALATPDTAQELGTGFVRVGAQLDLAPAGRALEPLEIFEALALAGAHELGVAPNLETAITQAAARIDDVEREDPELVEAFKIALFGAEAHPKTSSHLLDLGVLVAMLPEFAPLVCHVQHDVYHVYTTDEHTLRCVERARALTSGQEDAEVARWPMFRKIAREVADPELLLIACVMHDIGKNRGGGHSEKGAEMMPEIGRRLGLGAERTARLEFLVREHLVLSHYAQRRDTSDPKVLDELLALIEGSEELELLAALTFCDASTVGPTSMTDWRAALFYKLYSHLRALMQGRPSRHTRRLSDALTGLDVASEEDTARFIAAMPRSVVRERHADTLRELFRAWRDTRKEDVSTRVIAHVLEPMEVIEVVVVTEDQAGAMVKIAGVINASGFDIVDGALSVIQGGEDVLSVLHLARSSAGSYGTHRPQPVARRRLEQLAKRLEDVLDGEEELNTVVRRISEGRIKPRPGPSVEVTARVVPGASDDFTVLEVRAPDRPGLFYTIARSLWSMGVGVHATKLDLMGNVVVDTFYVLGPKGAPLGNEACTRLIRRLTDDVREFLRDDEL